MSISTKIAGAMLVLLLILAPAGALALAAGDVAPAAGGAIQAHSDNVNQNSNLGFLFAVYIISWAGFFAYVFMISRRQRLLEREIERLKRQVGEARAAERTSS